MSNSQTIRIIRLIYDFFRLLNVFIMVLATTASQNHRVIQVGRNLFGLFGLILLLSRGCVEQVAQDYVQMVLEELQGGNLTTSPGSLFQCSVTIQMKKCFLMFRWNFLCSSLCLLPHFSDKTEASLSLLNNIKGLLSM